MFHLHRAKNVLLLTATLQVLHLSLAPFTGSLKLPLLNQESTLPCTTRSHFWARRYCDQQKPLNKTKVTKQTNAVSLPPPFFSPLLPELAVEAWTVEASWYGGSALESNNDHMDHRGAVASVSCRAHASTYAHSLKLRARLLTVRKPI